MSSDASRTSFAGALAEEMGGYSVNWCSLER
jgi:hypothetical protein